jgi:hypothetical protein
MLPRLCVIAVVFAAACQSPAAPSSFTLTQRIETAHFIFRMADNDAVDTAWQEAYHTWAVAALQVNITKPITYNKYLSRVQMGDATGNYDTNAYANAEGPAFEIHTIWPRDNHEVVHLYSSVFGRTVSLFSEGLAVAFQINAPAGETVPKWSGTPLHTLARTFRKEGRLAPLSSIAYSNSFRTIDPNVAYPEAGSFVRFLIDTYGLDPLKRLYGASQPSDSAERIAATFASVYGLSLTDAERAWWAMLDTLPAGGLSN